MNGFLLQNEAWLRFATFVMVFAIMASWEIYAPRRVLTRSKNERWISNLGMVVLNTLLIRIFFPAAAVGAAVFVQERQWGVFNVVAWPGWIELLLSIAILDLVIYLQHVMFHAVPALWRLHRVHHADLDFDLTTGNRFHPIEMILSMVIKTGAIFALGPTALAVFLFEALLSSVAMFNHSNVRLALPVDRLLRLFLVTPDMHRVHHSVRRNEANSNFGFNLPWWDRLFGTYLAQPQDGHEEMVIGISTYRKHTSCSRLGAMLVMPFIGAPGEYPINRRDRL